MLQCPLVRRIQPGGVLLAQIAIYFFNVCQATSVPIAAQPAAFPTTDECHGFTRQPAFPDDLETSQVSRREFFEFGKIAKTEGIGYVGGCCGCHAAYVCALADAWPKQNETVLSPARPDPGCGGTE